MIDTMYRFLSREVDYVLLGDMTTVAGHPTFQQKRKPKYQSSPEELRLCANLLRHLDLVDLDRDGVLSAKVLRCERLLLSCGYDWKDVVSVFAHAALYFPSIRASVLAQSASWDGEEVRNVLCVLIFLAHAFLLDETCPIRIWHKWLFKDYCTPATLNTVVLRILELRRYRLVVSRKEWRGVSSALTRGPRRDEKVSDLSNGMRDARDARDTPDSNGSCAMTKSMSTWSQSTCEPSS